MYCVVLTILRNLGFHPTIYINFPNQNKYSVHCSINWNLVSPSYKSQYVKHGVDFVNTYGVPYDYGSIMHYPSYGELITRDTSAQTKIGQRNRLSFNDIKLANVMYKCPGEIQQIIFHILLILGQLLLICHFLYN